MEYEPPIDREKFSYRKFVRVGDRICVTNWGDVDTDHSRLAETDGVLDDFQKQRKVDPQSVDAGQIGQLGNILVVGLHSITLGLTHVNTEAREATVKLIQERSEGFIVRTAK